MRKISGEELTVRRIFWTLGMTLIGLFLALKGQDVQVNVTEMAIGGIWGAAIGYGIGSIFDQRRPGRRLIIYWAVTLALLGLFFGPLLSVASFVVRQALGCMIGALVGVLLGIVHLKVASKKLQAPDVSATAG